MLKRQLRNAAYKVAPDYVVKKYLRMKMLSQARQLRQFRESGATIDELLDAVTGSHFFRPLQKRSEILQLLETISERRPSTLCEIGAAGGGTTFLFGNTAATDATIVTIDLDLTESRARAFQEFAGSGQKLACLRKDSHELDTVNAVRDLLAGRELDVLYLDGDHSYEGVKSDFESYGPLVRDGGLIVFHDIVPDYRTRYGIETVSETGGVPQFWAELKTSYANVEEIIEDPEQDGFGIGILHWPASGRSKVPEEKRSGQAVRTGSGSDRVT